MPQIETGVYDQLTVKQFEILAELWKRRDEMRIAFLKFYVSFLAGLVAIAGYLLKDRIGELKLSQILDSTVVSCLAAMAFLVGMFTFLLVLYVRRHNLKCIYCMEQIAAAYEEENKFSLAGVVRELRPRLRALGGIDFSNALLITLMNIMASTIAAVAWSQEFKSLPALVAVLSFTLHLLLFIWILRDQAVEFPNQKLVQSTG